MEYRCQEVVEELRERGHQVFVLTSKYGTQNPILIENNIYRVLNLESEAVYYRPLDFFVHRHRKERENIAYLQQLLNSFNPDIVFVWGMWNLSRDLPRYVESNSSSRVVYSLASDWLIQPNLHEAYWKLPSARQIMRPFKWLAGKFALMMLDRARRQRPLQLEYAICVSNALRKNLLNAGAPLKNVQIIYPGIDLDHFLPPKNAVGNGRSEKHFALLYAGSLVSHKGIHTVIDAVSLAVKSRPEIDLKLTILGSGFPDYEKLLKDMVVQKNLQDAIQFIPSVPRQQMPELLSRHKVLLFPSIWQEPFSRVVLEAMATGLVVVGTLTGGTGELLIDGQTGLTFEPENPDMLAQRIEQLYDNPILYATLAKNGRDKVLREFSSNRMIDEIETYLETVI
jgi:glycosyltransferase involved in cell wall biosynthesis